jgi:ATP-binding cassette subfamily C protein
LFHESILVNVTLGDLSITSEKVEMALREAGIWDFVSALPRGIETIVGERGARLSGGQRQRIAIARALARNPKLLILDEATTALDPQTEAEICETLKQLARKVTILAISHQTALMDVADVVYHLDGGTIKRIRKISNDIRMVNP